MFSYASPCRRALSRAFSNASTTWTWVPSARWFTHPRRLRMATTSCVTTVSTITSGLQAPFVPQVSRHRIGCITGYRTSMASIRSVAIDLMTCHTLSCSPRDPRERACLMLESRHVTNPVASARGSRPIASRAFPPPRPSLPRFLPAVVASLPPVVSHPLASPGPSFHLPVRD
jgi:hypothetical protein